MRRSAIAILMALSASASAEEFPFDMQGLDPSTGITDADKGEAEKDRLHIGGALRSEYLYADLRGEGDTFLAPFNLWLYLDSRLGKDVRGFVKMRGTFDPTRNGSGGLSAFGLSASKYASVLEEMKLMFNVKSAVFFTLGKQKIKWGSGKVWNPTDFLNTIGKDPLRTQDERAGVTLVKTHVPIGNANLYLLQALDDADKASRIGPAARVEIPIGNAEFALSAAAKQGKRSALGFDVSSALGDFDVYFEGAYHLRQTSEDAPLSRWVAGASYDWKYSDSDTASFSLEYFQSSDGETDSARYPLVMATRGYQPYQLSRSYGALVVYLPTPGNWNDLSFSLINLMNLNDRSVLTRLETTVTSLRDLTFAFGVGLHYGDDSGEFRMGGQRTDVSARMSIEF